MKQCAKTFLLLFLVMIFFGLSISVNANALNHIDADYEMNFPEQIAVKEIYADLKIFGGTASCKGKVSVNPGYTADVLMQLQRKTSSGGWMNITFWTGTATGSIPFNTTKTYGNLTQNETYRLFISANVYKNGAFIESASSTSIEITN